MDKIDRVTLNYVGNHAIEASALACASTILENVDTTIVNKDVIDVIIEMLDSESQRIANLIVDLRK